MSDDLEDLLRSEFAGRAESVPPAHDRHLADTAIVGAGRIRRRRRIAGVASGAGLTVLAAAALVWTPSIVDLVDTDEAPAAATFEQAQDVFEMEFVVERDDGWGVVDQAGDYVPLPTRSAPYEVYGVEDGYLFQTEDQITLASHDGGATVLDATEDSYLQVRSDGGGLSVETMEDGSELFTQDLYRATAEGLAAEPRSVELSGGVTLADWSQSTVVLYAELYDVTGGVGGTYNFNEEFDYGLESAAEAGFESVVLVDWDETDYVCVSDLEPGQSQTSPETCGSFEGDQMDEQITLAADADAVEPVTTAIDGLAGFTEVTFADDIGPESMQYVDPLGRWTISFESDGSTWSAADLTADGGESIEFSPPDGALMPVLSHN